MTRSAAIGWALLCAGLLAVWGVDLLVVPHVSGYLTDVVLQVGFAVIAAAGLALVLGFTGQFSLGHAGFMALGAYTAAVMSRDAGTDMPVNLIVAGMVAGVAGVLVGVPSLRLTGDYLAVVTLGFNLIVVSIIENIGWLGGAQGISLPRHVSFGWTYTWVVLTLVALRNLLSSHHGRVFEAVRDNEIATRSLGIDTTRAKVTAFAVGAFFAGVAGALVAHRLTFIRSGSFTYDRSIELLAMVVLGGSGSLSGPVIAAALLTALPEVLRNAGSLFPGLPTSAQDTLRKITDYRMIVYSLLLIGMMILRPKGLLGNRELSDLFRRRAA